MSQEFVPRSCNIVGLLKKLSAGKNLEQRRSPAAATTTATAAAAAPTAATTTAAGVGAEAGSSD